MLAIPIESTLKTQYQQLPNHPLYRYNQSMNLTGPLLFILGILLASFSQAKTSHDTQKFGYGISVALAIILLLLIRIAVEIEPTETVPLNPADIIPFLGIILIIFAVGLIAAQVNYHTQKLIPHFISKLFILIITLNFWAQFYLGHITISSYNQSTGTFVAIISLLSMLFILINSHKNLLANLTIINWFWLSSLMYWLLFLVRYVFSPENTTIPNIILFGSLSYFLLYNMAYSAEVLRYIYYQLFEARKYPSRRIIDAPTLSITQFLHTSINHDTSRLQAGFVIITYCTLFWLNLTYALIEFELFFNLALISAVILANLKPKSTASPTPSPTNS